MISRTTGWGARAGAVLARLALAACLGGLALSAQADGLARVEQSIFGMDCAPCAYGIERGIRKLPGVAEVSVSLNEGTATITFAANSPTTLENIRKVIRNNGFTPKAASVAVVGKLVQAGGVTWLETSNLPRYRITGATAAVDEALRAHKSGDTVRAEGLIPEAVDLAREIKVSRLGE